MKDRQHQIGVCCHIMPFNRHTDGWKSTDLRNITFPLWLGYNESSVSKQQKGCSDNYTNKRNTGTCLPHILSKTTYYQPLDLHRKMFPNMRNKPHLPTHRAISTHACMHTYIATYIHTGTHPPTCIHTCRHGLVFSITGVSAASQFLSNAQYQQESECYKND